MSTNGVIFSFLPNLFILFQKLTHDLMNCYLYYVLCVIVHVCNRQCKRWETNKTGRQPKTKWINKKKTRTLAAYLFSTLEFKLNKTTEKEMKNNFSFCIVFRLWLCFYSDTCCFIYIFFFHFFAIFLRLLISVHICVVCAWESQRLKE